MPVHPILQDAVAFCHRAEKRRVWIKTDGYTPACLDPGGMDFKERFDADWLTNYIGQEAELGMKGLILGAPDVRPLVNIFLMMEDFASVIHLQVVRKQDRTKEWVLVR